MLRGALKSLMALLVLSCSKSTPDSTREQGWAAADLPPQPPALLERRASCSEKLCKLDAFLPDAAYAKSSPGGVDSPAAIWLQQLRSESTVAFPRHRHLDLVAVVLEGSLLMATDDAGARAMTVWDAAYAPGAGASLRAEAGNASAIVLVLTDLPTLNEALHKTDAAWRERPGAPRYATFGKSEVLRWGGGAFQARIAFGGEGSQALGASLETLHAAPGSTIPEHEHPSWEHIAILAGRGQFRLGGEEHAVEPGKIFHIPKGVPHAFQGASGAPLLAVQSYTPSGQEQRFVRLARAQASKPKPSGPAQ